MLLLEGVLPSQATHREMPTGEYDKGLLVIIIALVSFGVIMVASSSVAASLGQHPVGDFHFLVRHVAYLSLGIVLAWMMTRIELKFIQRHPFLWLGIGFALLLAVFVPGLGLRINGAHRWLRFGPLSFQPVEAVKLILVVYMASYLVRHKKGVQESFMGTLNPLVVALMIDVLLLRQPDFGSAMLMITVSVGMIWLGGARMRNLICLGIPLVPAAAWLATSQSYRLQRLTSFLNPWDDPFNSGFQLVQALIAIGRGGLLGVGLGGSVQKLFYLPEAHTDFILAIIGEELGLVGIVAVLGLYALLFWRGFRIGIRGLSINQPFVAYVAFGISMMIGLQAMVSVGVNLGILPTKGLTLPLISFGGSSLLMTLAMLGVLLRCSYEVSRAEGIRQHAVRHGKTKKSEEAAA